MESKNNLPKEVYQALKLITEVFDKHSINYWLGGGIFQLISQNRYEELEKNFRDHDIDLHIYDSHKNMAFEALKACEDVQNVDFYPAPEGRIVKIAFNINNLRVECPLLFISLDDPNVVFFVSWGKKEDWSLSENERQRFYYFSLPKEIFSEDTIELGDLKIRIPKEEYVKILYK